VFICLLIFNPTDTLSSLVPLATIILGFSFVFGHSAQVLFESVRSYPLHASRTGRDVHCDWPLAHLHLLYPCVRRRGPSNDRRQHHVCQGVWSVLYYIPPSRWTRNRGPEFHLGEHQVGA
jgi:hypothetical protein